jgi:Cys-rich repeat protein
MDCIDHHDPRGPVCNPATEECGPCKTAADCAGNPEGLSCNTTTGMCGGCTTNAECSTSTLGHMCNTTTGTCGGCATNADCAGSGKGPVCDPNGMCVQCTTDASCPGAFCSPATETCVACLSAANCPTADSCANGLCVPEACTTSAMCPSGYSCIQGICQVQCCGPGQHAETATQVNQQPALAAAHAYAPNGCLLCPAADSPGVSFNLDSEDSPPGAVPPSATIATGLSAVVETTNGTMAIYNKTTGMKISDEGLQTFFAPVLPALSSPFLIDSVVVFDDLSNRFVVATLFLENVLSSPDSCDTFTCDSPQNAVLLYAVSNKADPTAGFSEMHAVNLLEEGTGPAAGEMVAPSGTKLGYNADAHVITVNMEGVNSGTPDHVDVIAITKSTVLDADPATFTYTVSALPVPHDFALAAATMHGAHAGDPMWLVEEAGFENGQTIRVVRMDSVLSAQPVFTDTDIAVTPYVGAALLAVQPTVGQNITADDTRVLRAAFRNGRLVATQNVGTATLQPKARWYEFDTTHAAPALTQQGTIDPGAGVDTYFPSIDISLTGALGISYVQSATNQYMSTYYAWQQAPPMATAGTLDGTALSKAGSTVYADFTGLNLAGDYSGMSADPTNPEGFCGVSEYANTDAFANWGTWITCFSNP